MFKIGWGAYMWCRNRGTNFNQSPSTGERRQRYPGFEQSASIRSQHLSSNRNSIVPLHYVYLIAVSTQVHSGSTDRRFDYRHDRPISTSASPSPCDVAYSSSLSNNFIPNSVGQRNTQLPRSIARWATMNLLTSPIISSKEQSDFYYYIYPKSVLNFFCINELLLSFFALKIILSMKGSYFCGLDKICFHNYLFVTFHDNTYTALMNGRNKIY